MLKKIIIKNKNLIKKIIIIKIIFFKIKFLLKKIFIFIAKKSIYILNYKINNVFLCLF